MAMDRFDLENPRLPDNEQPDSPQGRSSLSSQLQRASLRLSSRQSVASESSGIRGSNQSDKPTKASVRSENVPRPTRRTVHDQGQLQQQVREQLELERQQEEAEKALKLQGLSRCSLVSRVLVESIPFVTLTTLLTCYALLGDDLRLIFTNRPADVYFNICCLVCIVIFAFEIVLSVKGKEDYVFGFFFFLDLISTTTLVLDLTWVHDFLLGGDEEDMGSLGGGKTARIGARAARIVRVLRLVRILKLYKAVYEARAAQLRAERRRKKLQRQGSEHHEWDADDGEFDDSEMLMTESQVGKKLSEMTTRRVIILVLAMMMGLPFLTVEKVGQLPSATTYGVELVSQAFRRFEKNTSQRENYERTLLQYIYFHNWFARECGERLCPADYFSNIFWFGIGGTQEDEVFRKAQLAQVRETTVQSWAKSIQNQDSQFDLGTMPDIPESILSGLWNASCRTRSGKLLRQGTSLLRRKIQGFIDYEVECPEDLRSVERTKYSERLRTTEEYKAWHFSFYVDNRSYVRQESIMNIMVTGFVCLVLMVASIYISSDSQELVLKPVESMILKVNMIRINPLMATKLADDAFKNEEIQKAKAAKKQRSRWQQFKQVVLCKPAEKGMDSPMETIILEKTIVKLGTLLAIGFGEAGANIIGQNMDAGESAVVNAMVPGVQVECIIASARIRDFGVATEVLQKKVMTFVNQVAEIVHGVIDSCHGNPNRNTGDAFLAVWPTTDLEGEVKSKLADLSMFALVRIFAAVHRSAVLATYRGHPGLQQRLGEHTRVNLTFGLHYGWAIEGAVGSEFKIDASYLSPNVTVAETVERATEVYGVAILITSALLDLCTPEMTAKCRIIDVVLAAGNLKPLELFVIDLNCFFLELEEPVHFKWNSRQRFRSRQYLEGEKKNKLQPDCLVAQLFDTDLDINTMRAPYTLEFMQIFNMGFQNYKQGEWEVAGRILWNTRTMLGFEDGPSSALLRYMKETSDFQCPKGWYGIHYLEEFGRMGPPASTSGASSSAGRRRHSSDGVDEASLAFASQESIKNIGKISAFQSDEKLPNEASSTSSMLGVAGKTGGDVMKDNPLPLEPQQRSIDPTLDEVSTDVPVEEPALQNRIRSKQVSSK